MKYYKLLVKVPNISAKWPEGPKTAHIKNQYKAPVKVHSTRTLCTRVRARNFPPKHFFEQPRMSRDRVQSMLFWNVIFYFRSGFAIGFRNITKPQREAQSVKRSEQFEFLVGFNSSFRNVHAKSIMIVQTLGPESAKGRSSR